MLLNKIAQNMKPKASKYFLIIPVLFLLLVTACQEPLDFDYEEVVESKILIEGKITTDTTRHYVLISRTAPLNQSEIMWETGADVRITEGGNIINLTESEPGHYYTQPNVFGLIGKEYTLNVTLKNGEVYTAETKINNISEIDSIKFVYEEFENYGIFFHFLYFFGQEMEETGNAYLWNLKLNDTIYNDTLWKTNFVDDEMVNGKYIGLSYDTNYYGSFPIYTLNPSELKTDTVFVDVEMESIPHEYYDFWVTLMQQTVWVGSPFDANKAAPLSNISGDALGFFYGASVKRQRITYIRPEESKNVDQPIF